MVDLLDKYFIKKDHPRILRFKLFPRIEINRDERQQHFYIDVYMPSSACWLPLLDNIYPKNKESWVIALKQLVERISLEW